ncbi:hypothetical protein SAMN05421679_109129 [Epilithonimonas pallida]|uniref:Uncharacterized protein n=1 Tax=Epilithonimonas pallida TaxID=373671 RepID=A0ABY1R704_9FLAO|nr:hypothetical protein SAMN05421679_109129 [Epilithonimonas pallida]
MGYLGGKENNSFTALPSNFFYSVKAVEKSKKKVENSKKSRNR